jgi:hypothetical protein
MLKTTAKAASREAVADDSDRVAAQVDAVVATGRIARTLKSMAAIDRETLLLYAWADCTPISSLAGAGRLAVGGDAGRYELKAHCHLRGPIFASATLSIAISKRKVSKPGKACPMTGTS